MGDVLLKKRDFEAALAKLRRAWTWTPRGTGLRRSPGAGERSKLPTRRRKSRVADQRALRAPGVTARTYYVAGVLWRTKDPDSALDAFRKALEIDPSTRTRRSRSG